MDIIVHYPESPEMQRELSQKVSAVYAQTVIEKVTSMACTIEQKVKLMDTIKYIRQKEGGK